MHDLVKRHLMIVDWVASSQPELVPGSPEFLLEVQKAAGNWFQENGAIVPPVVVEPEPEPAPEPEPEPEPE